jgi:hypothetical protein
VITAAVAVILGLTVALLILAYVLVVVVILAVIATVTEKVCEIRLPVSLRRDIQAGPHCEDGEEL